MFSGIVEAQSKIIKTEALNQAVRIQIERPVHFDDLKIGDSICTNGVCLTIEKFDEKIIQFCLAAETLKVIGSHFNNWKKYKLNLERSLQFGDRVHGHLVTGHVDATAEIKKTYQQGDNWFLEIQVPKSLQNYFWQKGSACINGVSLTVNAVSADGVIDLCLIPETVKATNLTEYKANEFVSLECDYLARYIANQQEKAMTL